MALLDLGKVGVMPGGSWDEAKEYDRLTMVVNDVEGGGDGCGYVSLKANKGVRPGTDDTVWAMIVETVKGKDGDPGDDGTDGVSVVSIEQTKTSDESGGTNEITVTLSNGKTQVFGVKNGLAGKDGKDGKKGDQGNTGSSVDYPFELVNNLKTGDATKALSAAQGWKLAKWLPVFSDQGFSAEDVAIQDGTVHNAGNAYAVRTVPMEVKPGEVVRVVTDRPCADGCYYVYGYSTYAELKEYEKGASYPVSQSMRDREYGLKIPDNSITIFEGEECVSFNFVQYNPVTNAYIALRTTDFDGYRVCIVRMSGTAAVNTTLHSRILWLESKLLLSQDDFEIGNIAMSTSGWTFNASSSRVRMKQGVTVHLNRGDVIGLRDYSAARYYLGCLDSSGSYSNVGWLQNDYCIVTEGDYTMLLTAVPEAVVADYTDLARLVFIERMMGGPNVISPSHWRRMLNLGTNAAKIYGYATARLSIAENMYAEDDLYVIASEGYQFGVNFRDSEGKFLSDPGWKTSYRIPKGSYYTFTLARKDNASITPDECVAVAFSFADFNNISLGERFLSDRFDRSLRSAVRAIAHRGLNTVAPENTMPAYELAKKAGFAYVETDVSLTADGVPVLLHDSTIDRTSTGSGNVSSFTYAELLEFDFGSWKSSAYAGTRIPTLEEFLIYCKSAGLRPYVELKDGTESLATACMDVAAKCGMMRRISWISFSSAALLHIIGRDPRARVGLVINNATYTESTIQNLTDTFTALNTGRNEIFLDALSVNDVTLNACILAGVEIEIWTKNNPLDILSLPDYVSGVTSDNQIASEILYYKTMDKPNLII